MIVFEDTCREVVGRADAFDAVEAIFAALAKGDAYNFPVIREAMALGQATPLATKSATPFADTILAISARAASGIAAVV